MWRSGSVKTNAAEPETPAPRLPAAYRVLIVIVTLAVVVVFVFPVVFDPGVVAPAELDFGNPSSVAIQIGNQNVTPLLDVEYACDLASLTLANGSAVTNARELVRGSLKKIPARRAIGALRDGLHSDRAHSGGRIQTDADVPGLPLAQAPNERVPHRGAGRRQGAGDGLESEVAPDVAALHATAASWRHSLPCDCATPRCVTKPL